MIQNRTLSRKLGSIMSGGGGNGGSTTSTNFLDPTKNSGFGIGANGTSTSPREVNGRKSWPFDKFCTKLENDYGRKLNDNERNVLDNGCIGLVCWGLGITTNPSLMGGMREFDKIKKLADGVKEEIDSHRDFYGEDTRVVIYGVMFQSDEPSAFRPNKDGIIDVTEEEFLEIDRQAGEDRLYNFDFGLYDYKTDRIYDATRKEPGMRVYENTIKQFDGSFGNRTIYFYRVTSSRIK